jgi:hypothetical protein
MSLRYGLFFAVIIFIAGGCMDAGDEGIVLSSLNFDFNQEMHSWQPGFSDYPVGKDDSIFYELKYAYTDAPAGISAGKSIMISGNNHSDDLFMYLKRQVTGLKPDAYYSLTFTVELASNAATGSIGIGGSPGEAVFLKAGASDIEPRSIVQNGNYAMNIDKGNQSTAGTNMITIGDIATSKQSGEYAIINRSSSIYNTPFEAQTNSDGELWLIVGTDSGFEGITTLYYTKINVVLSFKD